MTPEAQLETFIDKFAPDIAALIRSSITEMQKRYPNAVVLVYDNYNALAIGFGPNEKTSDCIFSIAAYAKKVNLNFLTGGRLPIKDPGNLLQGSGSLNRFVTLESESSFGDPMVLNLMEQAVTLSNPSFDTSKEGYLIIKSISDKQRPRR